MTRAMVMTPIDFWASFAPWLRARQTEETICILLKKAFAPGVTRRLLRNTEA